MCECVCRGEVEAWKWDTEMVILLSQGSLKLIEFTGQDFEKFMYFTGAVFDFMMYHLSI